MIYTDEHGIVNIVYGFGSIMGFMTEPSNGACGYALSSTDPHEVGAECENFDDLSGKPACDVGVSVFFSFSKVESIDILIGDLEKIRKELINQKNNLSG